jgi:hypothetical protein
MPLVTIDSVKGLFSKQGTGLVSTMQSEAQALVSGSEIDTSLGFVTNVTSAANLLEADGDNVTLKDGDTTGQLLLLVNQSNFTIEFADGHLANTLPANAAPTLLSKNAVLFVWNGTAWSPTSQSLA